MDRPRSGSIGSDDEDLRGRALDDLDELIRVTREARQDLRTYQSALEKNRRHLARGGDASEMNALFDIRAVRATLTERLNAVEHARSVSRVSLWRLQVSEGLTIAEIARSWGFSRQLVSRALASKDG